MIKANELRIGNYIQYKDGTVMPVEWITMSSVTLTTPKGGNWHFMYDEVNPIPLTEQWLLDFGFNPRNLNPNAPMLTYDRFKFSYKSSYNYWYVVDDHSSTYLTKIEFVHEAQNFIHAMNNQELTLKQPII